MELSLKQCFGETASQNLNYLTINKLDLPLLTPRVNNTAESLLVAILLQLLANFSGMLTDPTDNPITSPSLEIIDYDNSMVYETEVMLWKPFISENQIINQIIITYYELYAD